MKSEDKKNNKKLMIKIKMVNQMISRIILVTDVIQVNSSGQQSCGFFIS